MRGSTKGILTEVEPRVKLGLAEVCGLVRSVPTTKRISLRNTKWLAIFTLSTCALVWMLRGINIYWDDPRIINFLAAWIPAAGSTLLAFVPDREMTTGKRWVWRSSVMAVGFSWSAILWHQQVIGDRATLEVQRKVVTEAVTQSNQHSDQLIGRVRADVQEVKGDVQGVQKKIEGQSDAISKSTSTINESIGKVGKPEPPKKADVQFSFWELNPDNWPKLEEWVEVKGNIASVDVTARTLGDISAKNGLLILRVCERCKWAQEPSGFLPKDNDQSDDRMKRFDLMLPDVAMTKMHMDIEIPPDFVNGTAFTIGGIYSCENCPPADPNKRQNLTVHVVRAMPQ